MDIDALTIGQLKQLKSLMTGDVKSSNDVAADFIGACVIVRTYSAGVWCGRLDKKSGNEVIVTGARRLWKWKAQSGISLSSVANVGIVENESRIEQPVAAVWLEAIELIPVLSVAEKTIMSAKHAVA